jgi:major membrane immunogen (membrane-anchored lipoprotein)
MGIYTSAGVLAYTVGGSKLDTSLALSSGTYATTVQEWDYCGGSATAPVTITVTNSTGVQVSAPANNGTVGSPVNFKATATSTCSLGVASMGIYTAPGQLAYTGSGSSLNTNLTLSAGTYNTVVQEWDYCGGSASTPIKITVNSGNQVFSNIQTDAGWNGYILLPPSYGICSSCSPNGPQETWWTKQNVSSPSLSGKAMEFNIGGSTAYSDVLWNIHLVGDGAPNLDSDHKIVPTIYNFIYDAYFYSSNLNPSQALEFDINQFVNGLSYIWGTECRIMGGNQWDIWDNINNRWVPTGVSCNPNNNQWNHVTIQVQRTWDNKLFYQSITLNGKTSYLNQYYSPTSSSWYGVTVNYQMDGNHSQQTYNTYLDNFNLTYW